jgi:hypothetical protein
MAPSRDHKGKTTDRSTDWSEPVWDERGFYVSSRKNSLGDWVYDYRYPDETRTQQDLQTVPRSPGPNVLVNSYFPAARSSGASSYGTYAGSSTSNSATQYGNSYGYGPRAHTLRPRHWQLLPFHMQLHQALPAQLAVTSELSTPLRQPMRAPLPQ